MDWLARKIGWIGWREKNEMDGWNCWEKNWKRETWDGLAGEKKGMDWLARKIKMESLTKKLETRNMGWIGWREKRDGLAGETV